MTRIQDLSDQAYADLYRDDWMTPTHVEARERGRGILEREKEGDAAKDGDYRVEDVEFLDGEDSPPDARDARGGRGKR